jgi:alkane 1-monooxygenase
VPSFAAPPQTVSGPTTWHDTKRYAWLLGLFLPLLPFIGAALVRWTGAPLFWWFGAIFIFGLLPLLDVLVGKDSANPPDSVVAALEHDRYYRWCTFAFLPLQYASLIWACTVWSHGNLTWTASFGLAISVGLVGGVGINTAHELGHKSEAAERWLSKVGLAQSCYGHFYVEHNRGHHMRVATPEDPASSRLGESFWPFLPRTVVGSAFSAWGLESQRLQRKGVHLFSWHNDVLHSWAMSAALFAALLAVFGLRILPWLVIQAVIGFSVLEIVNYVEHYGLARRKLADGRYEPCAPRHSWNSNNVVSNVMLYHLQRHSDHHAYPSRRYQCLRSFDEAPELPSGYGAMILVALIPPLWRAVMDHRVCAHYAGNLTLANVQPSQRNRYGLPA